MMRAGILVVPVAVVWLLAGCAGDPVGDAPPESSAGVESPARHCPAGFADAFTTYLEGRDFGIGMPSSVQVLEDSQVAPGPSELGSELAEGCVVRVELGIPHGIQAQIVGITAGSDEAAVLAILGEAGWQQPFPDTDPQAYSAPSRDASVAQYTVDSTDPAFGFPGWSDFFADSEVVLVAAAPL